VQAGGHGRRREGAGEAFWAFRPYRPGDEPRRIDWRRSARGDEVLVREREQAVAATVLAWPDRRTGMRWRSHPTLPTKAERAMVLALALATLLGRGGERCGLLGGGRPATGLQAGERFAEALSVADENAAPPPAPRGAQRVLLTDALDPAWAEELSAAGDGVLVRIVDPAEAAFPYAGRTMFSDPAQRSERLLGRAEAVQAAYGERWRAHVAAVDAEARRASLRVLEHRTDQPAATALLALWRAVSGAG
jgi:uncharacterized protein (DUF58 family)